MNNLVKFLDLLLAVYFVIISVVYGIIPVVGLFANGTWWNRFLAIQPWWARLILLVIILVWIYAPYYLMQKSESKYNYCLAVLVGVGFGYQLYKFIVLDNYSYTVISWGYLAFFIIPLIVVILTYYLHHISFVRKK